MKPRGLFLLLLAYLAFDLADPVLPGAFSFEPRDSEVEEAIHVQRGAAARNQAARRSTPLERPAPSPDPARVSPAPGTRLVRAPRAAPTARRAARPTPAAARRAPPPEDH